jgi:hypothetical protein
MYFSSLFLTMMPHLLDEMIGVRDWAPPGWHWEVLPSRACSLVRNLGRVVNLELLWWRSCGPGVVQREPSPEEVVHQRIQRRTSISVVTCICWKGFLLGPGRFFWDLTLAMIP